MIVNVMKESGCEVPEWMLKLKNPTKQMKKNLKYTPIARESLHPLSSYDEKKAKQRK